jgi:uncharacterized metal-binding protein YceD (DUF177 family)
MKYTLAQLRKVKMPFLHEEDLDLSASLNGVEDIISSSICHVKEIVKRLDDNTYEVNQELDIDLILTCAITLEEVPYKIHTKNILIYSKEVSLLDEGESYPIEHDTLDTTDAIITNILCEKPMVVTKDGASFDSEENPEEDKINPAFASLKDLL